MNIFYFVSKWPRSKDCSRFDKIISMTQTFLNNGHQICMMSPDSTDPDSSEVLQGLPIDKVFIHPRKIGQALASAMKKPDMALFNSYEMEQEYSIFMYSKWNKCPRVLQINNLVGLQHWRKKNYLSLASPFLQPYDIHAYPQDQAPLEQKFDSKELQSIKRSDFYFCGNDFISYYIKRHLNKNNYILTSLGIPMGDFRVQVADLQYRQHHHRKHFVFIGNMFKERNALMVNMLIQNIWIGIKKVLPDVQLHIYGAGTNKNLMNRKKELEKIGIIFKGVMEDTRDLQKYRALLYPAQYATGIKGAVVESWFQHTPVITTPIGAEGLFLESSQPIYSANNYGDPYQGFFKEKALSEEQKRGKVIIQQYYNRGILSDKIKQFTFGGLCNSFSFSEFIENAIKIYTDEHIWKECLIKSRTCFLKHHTEMQMEVNLNYGVSQIELAAFEGRKKKQYSEQWDKYVKSKEAYNKLHDKSK